jgi:hypothetical protein
VQDHACEGLARCSWGALDLPLLLQSTPQLPAKAQGSPANFMVGIALN